MKVKVGNKVFDGKNEPVMVILSDSDKHNITNMLPECTKYACFPDRYGVSEAAAFMKTDDDCKKTP